MAGQQASVSTLGSRSIVPNSGSQIYIGQAAQWVQGGGGSPIIVPVSGSIVYGPQNALVSNVFWPNGSITAASASQADVQAAVNAASDGMVVFIPDGSSAVWTTGIVTTKQICIRAQTVHSTYLGRTTQSVTISNQIPGGTAGLSPCISMTSGNNYHVGVAGIYFASPLGGGSDLNYGTVFFTGTGNKVPLIWDCVLECNELYTGNVDAARVTFHGIGGIMWNCWWQPHPGGNYQDGVGCAAVSTVTISPYQAIPWKSNSTMGTLDAGGINNVYLEGNTFLNASYNSTPDIDKAGRAVIRYNLFDGCGLTTHGYTSDNTGYNGGRHVEIYNNIFQISNANRNVGGKRAWFRMGTAVIFSNQFLDQVGNNYSPKPGTMGESNPNQGGGPYFDSGGVPLSGDSYPIPSQPGMGWYNGAPAADPIYVWNNSYATKQFNGGVPWGIDTGWANGGFIQYGRDVMDEYHGLSGGAANLAKPSGAWNGFAGAYAPLSFPHPIIIQGNL